MLAPAFIPAAIAAPVPRLVKPLVTFSGILKLELFMLIVF